MFRPKNPDPDSHLAHIPIKGRSGIEVATSPYPFPNDPEESKRLDLQDFILRRFLKSAVVAPIGPQPTPQASGTGTGSWTNFVVGQIQLNHTANRLTAPQRILDVGCGTGQWAIEMARQFPQTTVVGIDIVTMASASKDVIVHPPNYHFQQGNILQGLPFGDCTFDYVHMRFLSCGIPGHQWQTVMNELVRLTAPGGWVESVESTTPSNSGPALAIVQAALTRVLIARGVDLGCTRTIDSYMRQATAPLSAVQSRMLEIPIGIQGKAIGQHMAWNMLMVITNMGYYFQQAGIFSREEWETLLKEVDTELYGTTYQPVLPLYVAIGQRQA